MQFKYGLKLNQNALDQEIYLNWDLIAFHSINWVENLGSAQFQTWRPFIKTNLSFVKGKAEALSFFSLQAVLSVLKVD